MMPLLCAKASASQTFWKMVRSEGRGFFCVVASVPLARRSSTFFKVMPRTSFMV